MVRLSPREAYAFLFVLYGHQSPGDDSQERHGEDVQEWHFLPFSFAKSLLFSIVFWASTLRILSLDSIL